MLVAPQTIEASLVARRLQRWGGQTCMVSDIAVAQALLPERSWHAVLLDHAFGATEVAALGEAARVHATQRILMFTPAARHDAQTFLGFHRLSGQAVAGGLARGSADRCAGNRRRRISPAIP